MIARAVYGGAAILLAVALVGLRASVGAVAHYRVTLPGGAPAVVYEPGAPAPFGSPQRDGPPLPVVVLAHGFSANKGMMSSLARRLTKAGYAVLAFDFRGHGENRAPFGSDLVDDVDAAVLWARMQSRFDGARVAVAGHSMGGGAALGYGSREPNVAAVIAISAAGGVDGPYPPPNVLLIWAGTDPKRLRDRAKQLGAELAGLSQLVMDNVYGEPERSTAVRLTEVGGFDHPSILYSGEAAARIVDWLALTLGPGAPGGEPAAGDGRFGWALLGFAAWLTLLWGAPGLLAPVVPRVTRAATTEPLRRLAVLATALVAALLLLAGADAASDRSPFAFVPLVAARDLIGVFAVTGGGLLLWLALRGELSARGLAQPGTWAGAAALLAFAYVGFGSVVLPFVDAWLTPQRLPVAAGCAALSLPFWVALEWLLRGPGRAGVWAPIAGRALLVAVLAASAWIGLVSFVVLLGLLPFALLFALLELAAYRIERACPNPWMAALLQAGWTGWALAAVFPYAG